MLKVLTPLRGIDAWGDGSFGAPRGDHKHRGIDFAAAPDSLLCSPVDGHITKVGYPYKDDLSYRYVQVTDSMGHNHRFFYVEPVMKGAGNGQKVMRGDVIGFAQDVAARYDSRMKNHIHYEVIRPDGTPIDPRLVIHEE